MKTILVNDRVRRRIGSSPTIGTVIRLFRFGGVHVRWDDGKTSIEHCDNIRPANRLCIIFGKSIYC